MTFTLPLFNPLFCFSFYVQFLILLLLFSDSGSTQNCDGFTALKKKKGYEKMARTHDKKKGGKKSTAHKRFVFSSAHETWVLLSGVARLQLECRPPYLELAAGFLFKLASVLLACLLVAPLLFTSGVFPLFVLPHSCTILSAKKKKNTRLKM